MHISNGQPVAGWGKMKGTFLPRLISPFSAQIAVRGKPNNFAGCAGGVTRCIYYRNNNRYLG
jgi:hypothetical protein